MHALRIIAIIALALLVWPEIGRYRAEWMLAETNGKLELILLGRTQGAAAVQSAIEAEALSRETQTLLPADPRSALLQSVALILLGRGAAAIAVLEPAIADGERPELTINLGRARSTLGDEAGANAAYLRTAWASPAAIATLPKAMQSTLLTQVKELEVELRAGRMAAPPPLN